METKNLAEIIHARTVKWATRNGFNTSTELTPEQKKWKVFFDNHHHSCDNIYMIDLVAELTGIDMSFAKPRKYGKTLKYTFGIAIIPKGNSNSHNYPLGEVALCKAGTSGKFVKKNGAEGNHMTNYAHDITIPTLMQIEDYLKSIAIKNKSFYASLASKLEA